PALADDVRQTGEERPVARGQIAAGLSVEVGGLEDLAVCVELHLLDGPIADPHRNRAAVALEVEELEFGQRPLAANAVHDLEIRRATGAGALQPELEVVRLLPQPEREQ